MEKTLQEVQADFDDVLGKLEVMYEDARNGNEPDETELGLTVFLASTIASVLTTKYGVPIDEVTAKIDSYLDYKEEA